MECTSNLKNESKSILRHSVDRQTLSENITSVWQVMMYGAIGRPRPINDVSQLKRLFVLTL